jgi:uncharacterized protein (DUF1330 family)
MIRSAIFGISVCLLMGGGLSAAGVGSGKPQIANKTTAAEVNESSSDRRCKAPRSGRPGYLVVTMKIHDRKWVPGYERRDVSGLMMREYGACYIVRSASPEKIEGDGEAPSVVAVIEFPSLQEARRFLNSPEYKPVREARERAATTHIYAVE